MNLAVFGEIANNYQEFSPGNKLKQFGVLARITDRGKCLGCQCAEVQKLCGSKSNSLEATEKQ